MAADTGTELAPPETNAGLRALAGHVKVGGANGLAPQTLAEVMDFAQLMAKAGPMVGKAFRNNPGACVAITMQAMQWGMNPFAVSQKAYTTGDNIGYEAQLVTAVINAHAPVKERPKFTFEGEGAKRRCTVTATLKGESEACVYQSPEVGTITTKNSPLWKQDPDQQLSYFSIRAWARRYCPEVIMGVYAIDELDGAEPMTVARAESLDGPRTYDQRTDDEVAEESGGAFIMGEAAKLVTDHYTRLFETSTTVEEIEKHWASFQRKYWVGKRRCISNNTFTGVEHLCDNAKVRLEDSDAALKRIKAAIESATDLHELEAWRADALTDARWAKLNEEQNAEAQAIYEAAQEQFAEAEYEALRQQREEAPAQ